ncbi:MAG: LysR substrate-binding domain-containing protein [Rubrivivax sp.]|nr:LysR substrate-binding domain-containing protein [Rubrivivax sp.]
MDRKPRPHLSLALLKGFEAAARHLSFTRAGEELSLTQSAVSREIKKLEEQLGHPLFDRIHRGLRLTPPGHVLYRAVGEALKLIDEATDRLGGSAAMETLTVTTSAPLASIWLVPKISRFLRLHPEVDVRCIAANQWLDLDRERCDVALRWSPPGTTVPDAERVFDVKIFPVSAPTVAADRSRPLRSLVDLARHVLLDLETTTGSGPWSDWAPWLEAKGLAGLKPAGAMRFSHYDQVVQAAIDGSGVAVGRSPHNDRHLGDGLLVAPLGAQAVLDFGSYFVRVSPRAVDRLIVRKFVAWLHEEIRQDARCRAPGPAQRRLARR